MTALPAIETMDLDLLRDYAAHLRAIGNQRWVTRGPGSPAERRRVAAELAKRAEGERR